MNAQEHIGDIVTYDYRSASVFRKYGIDFCCGGGKSLESVCEAKGISPDELLSDLMTIGNVAPEAGNQYKDWSFNQLIDHIIDKHHSYTKNTLADLDQYLRKVAKVHGDYNPELHGILSIFISLMEELTLHMNKEEMVLFPYIRKIERCKESNTQLERPPFGTIENPIRMMENEHDMAGNGMKEIRRLSNDFTPPEHACNTYLVSFKVLEEFEMDLHKHIHLENNILFPRAIQLETEIFKNQ